MKKLDKVLSVLLIVLMLSCVAMTVFAVDTSLIDNVTATNTAADGQFARIGSVIVSYITTAAMILSVVLIAVLGIKYMMGSLEEKAEYKKSLVPLLVGAALVFGASALAKIIIALVTSFSNTTP